MKPDISNGNTRATATTMDHTQLSSAKIGLRASPAFRKQNASSPGMKWDPLSATPNYHIAVTNNQIGSDLNKFPSSDLGLKPLKWSSLLNVLQMKPKSNKFQIQILSFLLRFLKRFKSSSIHICRDAQSSLSSLTSDYSTTGLFVYLGNLDIQC